MEQVRNVSDNKTIMVAGPQGVIATLRQVADMVECSPDIDTVKITISIETTQVDRSQKSIVERFPQSLVVPEKDDGALEAT